MTPAYESLLAFFKKEEYHFDTNPEDFDTTVFLKCKNGSFKISSYLQYTDKEQTKGFLIVNIPSPITVLDVPK